MDKITFGSGCFWCTESFFTRLKGVLSVESGYMGGKIKNPTYREICSGLTEHAEVVQVTFDSDIISVKELLEVFFKTHDPTTLNRQGADKGTQYRSAIFYESVEQKELSLLMIKELDEAKVWSDKIVTEVTLASMFYKAEEYHQNYYELNGNQPYCSFVITPKLKKFEAVFADKLK